MKTMKRIGNAALGFALGALALPLVPFVFAWFLWHESDGLDEADCTEVA